MLSATPPTPQAEILKGIELVSIITGLYEGKFVWSKVGVTLGVEETNPDELALNVGVLKGLQSYREKLEERIDIFGLSEDPSGPATTALHDVITLLRQGKEWLLSRAQELNLAVEKLHGPDGHEELKRILLGTSAMAYMRYHYLLTLKDLRHAIGAPTDEFDVTLRATAEEIESTDTAVLSISKLSELPPTSGEGIATNACELPLLFISFIAEINHSVSSALGESSYAAFDVPESEIPEWRETEMEPYLAAKWRAYQFSPDEAAAWNQAKLDPHRAHVCRLHGIDPEGIATMSLDGAEDEFEKAR